MLLSSWAARIALLLSLLVGFPVSAMATRVYASEALVSLPPVTDAPCRRAVILFGGIYETYHYWDGWVESLGGPDTRVYGFDHNHTSVDMPTAAHVLAQEIERLQDGGIVEVTIVAHSMAGLVSKAALDEVLQDSRATGFTRVDLYAFGTPWGGFLFAEPAHFMPGSKFISRAIGLPMGPDIGPGSAFMESLGTPWPSNMHLHLYIGSKDTVAAPGMFLTRKRYQAVAGIAESVTVVPGLKHKDYASAKSIVLPLDTPRLKDEADASLPTLR